jgi:subtilisin family serine protease
MIAAPGRLEVRVSDTKHQPIRGAAVRLLPVGKEKGRPFTFEYDSSSGAHVALAVPPGRYRLSVGGRGVQGEERVVEINPGVNQEKVVLGRKGLPYYYRGRVRVPFEPTGLVGVALRARLTTDSLRAFDARARELKLTESDDASMFANREAARVFRLPPRTGREATAEILAALSTLAAVRVAGLVLEATRESLVFLTSQVIARFDPSVKDDQASAVAERHGAKVVRKIPYVPNGWLLETSGPASYEVLDLCQRLMQAGRVLYVEPNTVNLLADLQINPTDWLVPEQWHVGIVNLPTAWETLRAANAPGVNPGDPGDLTFGSANVVVGIMDRGIQSNTVAAVTTASHPDFQGNVTTGAAKVAQFFDFTNMVANNDAPPNDHGMGCAGVAGARANNASAVAGLQEGVVGAAPNCRLFGAIRPATGTDQQYADAFIWMAGFNPGWTADGVNYPAGTVFPAVPANPVDIISNSYTWPAVLSGVMADMIHYVTTFGRGGRGVAIFWAAGNGNAVSNYGTTNHPKVLTVAASTLANDGVTEVRGAYSNFGNVVQFCTPSHDAYVGGVIVHNPPANYGVISADLVGQGNMPGSPAQQTALTAAAGPSAAATNLLVGSSAGFAVGQAALVGAPGAVGTEAQMVVNVPNATTVRVAALRNAHPIGTALSGGPANYTDVFGGTSSATPLAAGIAALCLSVNPELSWVELRQILRTTAVQIDIANVNPTGQWIDVTGDGVVDFSQWYGWGRLDADAAVTAARDYDHDIDLVVRDNLEDLGAVPSGGWHAASPDIWTDPNDVAVPVLAYDAAPPHVTPVRGQDNYIFVRVKNVGTAPSSDYWVRALISHYPGFEFRFPQEWTPSNLPGQPVPNPLLPGSYLIGEVALTGLANGADTIAKMTWPAALVPDAEVMVAGMAVEWHPCLLAQVAPHDGPPPAGATFDVKRYNNLAHRNITIANPGDLAADLATAAVAGTSDPIGIDSIVLDRSLVPGDYRVFVRIADPRLMKVWLELVRKEGIGAAEPLPGSGAQLPPAPFDGPDDRPWPPASRDECRVMLLDPARLGVRCCGGDLLVVHAPAKTVLEFRCGTAPKPRLRPGRIRGQEVIFLDQGGAPAIELPARLSGGQFVPVVLGLARDGGLRGAALLLATQRRGDGELSAGYSVAG